MPVDPHNAMELDTFLSNLQELRAHFERGADVYEELKALEAASPTLTIIEVSPSKLAGSLGQLRFPIIARRKLPAALEHCLQELSDQELSQDRFDRLLNLLEVIWKSCDEAESRKNDLLRENRALERRCEAVQSYLELLEFWSTIEPARIPR